jgi:DNA modification methylase
MQIKSKEIELVSVGELIHHPKNMNEHSEDQINRLVKLIDYQGFRNPLVVQKGTNLVVAGNGRLMAARKMNLDKVPVIYQEFDSEAQLYAYMTSDNAIASWSHLDLSKVNLEMLDLGPDFDIDMLGIKDFVIEPIEKFEAQCGEDDVPEVVHPITRRGDIWLLGNHRLMCGDSTMIDDVEKLMNGEKADMVFTDPPYKIETKGGTKSDISQSLRKQGDSIEFIADFNPADFLSVLPSVFNKNMNAYVFCNKELLPDYLSWARDSGYSFNVLIWKKPNAIPIGDSHRPDIEYLILFRKNAIWNNGLKEVNYSRCLEYGREKGLHPTMKPVDLIKNELLISSNKNSNVVDFFNGSGSTLIACESIGRSYFGIELAEKYCDTTIIRWQNFTGKKATLELTGQTYEELKAERDLTQHSTIGQN